MPDIQIYERPTAERDWEGIYTDKKIIFRLFFPRSIPYECQAIEVVLNSNERLKYGEKG